MMTRGTVPHPARPSAGRVKVSCIIAAYNEEERIPNVLHAVVGHPLIDEVIVVDDCSTDATWAAAQKFSSVHVISNPVNWGKSHSVSAGVLQSEGDYVLFLDADLVGLTAANVTELLQPVLGGEADCSISLRRDALAAWQVIGLDCLSGERAMRRSLISDHVGPIARLPGFGIETYLNNLMIRERARIRVVRWPTVGHTRKVYKRGLWQGLIDEIRMLMNIMQTASPIRTGLQVVAMVWRAQA